MTGTGALLCLSASAARSVPARLAPIEKSNCNSRLDHGADGAKPSEPKRIPGRERLPASRYETDFDAPIWNGPRLRAAFVAQVLGQLLEAPPEVIRHKALSAYRAPSVTFAASIDDRA